MFLEACDAVPHELQRPLREVAEACAIDGGYLGWLLRAGRVAGTKRGGRWYTSEAAVPPGRPRRRDR